MIWSFLSEYFFTTVFIWTEKEFIIESRSVNFQNWMIPRWILSQLLSKSIYLYELNYIFIFSRLSFSKLSTSVYPIFWKNVRSFPKLIDATLVSMDVRGMTGLPFSIHKSKKGLARSPTSALHSFDCYFSINTKATYTILPISNISKYYPDVTRIQACGSLNVLNYLRLSR